MKKQSELYLVVISVLFFSACNTLRKLPGWGKDDRHETPEPPDIYTVTGVTQSDFDRVAVRVLNSRVTVRVNRQKNPQSGWHDCDQFEISLSTQGVGGGSVKFGFLNLTVGGVHFPVAPKGTQYEITSMKLSGSSARIVP